MIQISDGVENNGNIFNIIADKKLVSEQFVYMEIRILFLHFRPCFHNRHIGIGECRQTFIPDPESYFA